MSGGLIATLQMIVNRLTEHTDIDEVIAHYLLNHLYRDNFSINDIADDCHISKASVTRFAQSLGFEGFNELKKSYQLIAIEQDEMKIDLNAHGKKDRFADLQAEFDTVIGNLAAYNTTVDPEALDYLCELIHQAENVHIYATLIPGNMAEMMQHMFLTAGKFVEYYPQLHNQLAAAKKLKPGDLSLFISLEGSFVMQKDLTLTIKKSGANSVLITQNPEMKLASVFDYVVPLGAHSSERSGKYKLLMFAEYLAHRYFEKYV